MTHTILLGVNIDHIATLRQNRGTRYPDPLQAAFIAEQAGADGITVHLREDRRHIQDRDVEMLQATVNTRLNLEMAATDEIMDIACTLKPAHCCLVPEKREELTTEGGLDVVAQFDKIKRVSQTLSQAGIDVSLFIDPEPEQITAALDCGVPTIELHTGAYADATDPASQAQQLQRITQAADLASSKGLIVNAGHGLNYHNVTPIAAIPVLNELNIGHAIVARAFFTGLGAAVADMKDLILIAS